MPEFNKQKNNELIEYLELMLPAHSFSKMCNELLKKISVNFSAVAGIILLKKENFESAATFGLSSSLKNIESNDELVAMIFESSQPHRFEFHENKPVIKTGITDLSVNEILFFPLEFQKEKPGILELAFLEKLNEEKFEELKDAVKLLSAQIYIKSKLNSTHHTSNNNSLSEKISGEKEIFMEDLKEFTKQENLFLTESKIDPKNKKQILVIDSNPKIQNIISEYLSTKNFEVILSDNFSDGINKAKNLNPFGIVANAALSDKSGISFLSELKLNKKYKNIPLIFTIFYEELNLGYGLPVLDFFTESDIEGITNFMARLERLTNFEIKSVFSIDNSSNLLNKIKDQVSEKNIKLHFLKDPANAYRNILKVHPDILIFNAAHEEIDIMELIAKLKDNISTKEIPVLVTLPEKIDEKVLSRLLHNFEKVALKSRKHPIDVLKVIKDRLEFEIESPIDDSSTIWIDPKSDDPANREKSQKFLKTKSRNIKLKVLVVDDEDSNLDLIKDVLQNIGYEAVLAKSGNECLDYLQRDIPDLILLDIMMPKMDGFETIKKIKQDTLPAEIPVFALTSQAMRKEEDIILRNGFNDVVTKPVDSLSLSFKIGRLFNNSTEI